MPLTSEQKAELKRLGLKLVAMRLNMSGPGHCSGARLRQIGPPPKGRRRRLLVLQLPCGGRRGRQNTERLAPNGGDPAMSTGSPPPPLAQRSEAQPRVFVCTAPTTYCLRA
jgi:hypothetical protein